MTNTDILYLTGTLAIIILTGFFCMALYYAILILRRIHHTLDTAEKKVGSLFELWNEFYTRLLGLRTSLDIIASGCRAALSLYQRRMARDMNEPDDEYDEEDTHASSGRKGRKKT